MHDCILCLVGLGPASPYSTERQEGIKVHRRERRAIYLLDGGPEDPTPRCTLAQRKIKTSVKVMGLTSTRASSLPFCFEFAVDEDLSVMRRLDFSVR